MIASQSNQGTIKDKGKMCDALQNYDYIIVGAGPAGLQMAYFLQKSGRRYVVFEAAKKAACFFASNPRSGRLISINKRFNMFKEEDFNMRHDWNSLLSDDPEMKFGKYSSDLYPLNHDLHDYMNDYAQHFQLNIEYGTKVVKIGKQNSEFFVRTQKVDSTTEDVITYTTRCVLMATGAVKENIPKNVEGMELADTYAGYKLDKKLYQDKFVLVVGGGNSGFETAEYLADTVGIVHVVFRNKIKFAWNTHFVGDLRAVNNNILDMYLLKSLHSTIAAEVRKIVKTEDGKFLVSLRELSTHVEEPCWFNFTFKYDHVISCMGWTYVDTDIFDNSINLEFVKENRYPKLSNCWETNTENLFYIGTAMASNDRKSASGFVHGFRYNIRTLNNLLENRFFGKELPHTLLPSRDMEQLLKKFFERVTIAASLYQMNGVLCDVVTFDEEGRPKYYIDLPRNHVMEMPEFKTAKDLFIIVLAYGVEQFGELDKPVEHVRSADFTSNKCVSFLHPQIEHHSYGEYVDQTELDESLIVRYDKWTTSHLPQWSSSVIENYVKWYFNEKMRWTDEKINLMVMPNDVRNEIYIPLTDEEKSRIPRIYEETECKPQQDLLPRQKITSRVRKLRPTREDTLANRI